MHTVVHLCRNIPAQWSRTRSYVFSLFTNLLYAAVYFLQLQLWLVHEPVTPTMAACQPHLGAREGLDPLGSDLEGY